MRFNYTNNTGMGGLLIYANDLTGGELVTTALIGFSIVIYVGLKEFSSDQAFVPATIITAILGFLLAAMGIVNTLLPVIYSFLSIVAVFRSWYATK